MRFVKLHITKMKLMFDKYITNLNTRIKYTLLIAGRCEIKIIKTIKSLIFKLSTCFGSDEAFKKPNKKFL